MEHRNNGTAGHRAIAGHRSAPAGTLKPVIPVPTDKPSARHAAIRKALPTLATYKTWSAKARTDWEESK
jgi:hypothetical protein